MPIQLGALFPQNDFPLDRHAVRDYAQAVEGMGYDHVLVYDHVLGANTDRPDRAKGFVYNHKSPFHEPFVLYAYFASVTERIGLATGVIILPQRQTALVAKQAASLDFLSGGRLRLGVGIGWNAVEFEALGENFQNRAARVGEQIRLMRRLWTKPLITFEGKYHRVSDAGLLPLPVQRPIPVWMGGAQRADMDEANVDRVLRRMGRYADGWMLTGPPNEKAGQRFQRLLEHAKEAGRDTSKIGFEGAINYGDANPDRWREQLAQWKQLGATHVTLQSRGLDFTTAQQHFDALRKMIEALRPAA
ncbi:MAG TPA: LLM class F420-dependent oxidoreductase [Chloroflexota bacterium]|nr:LLM class F420-dependent oxidoreductase [Chloroflexota bacterium]